MDLFSGSKGNHCHKADVLNEPVKTAESLETLCGQRTEDNDGFRSLLLPPPHHFNNHPSLTDRGNLRTRLLHTSPSSHSERLLYV